MPNLELPKLPITSQNKFINICFTGLFVIFLDQERNRAMIGILDEKKHETQFLVNGKALKIGDKNFTESQKRWQVKLYVESQNLLSISRGGTFEKGDAFDYFVDLEKLEGCGNNETLPLRHEFFKGRFYLNAGEFKADADKKAFENSVVDFVRQDSRMPLSTWRPRPIAQSLQVTIPLIGVKKAELQIGNNFDFISVPLDISKDVKISIDNECGSTSEGIRDTDFVAFYKLIADNRTPAVPVRVSSTLQTPSINVDSSNAVHTETPDNIKPDIIVTRTLHTMCGGILCGNTESF